MTAPARHPWRLVAPWYRWDLRAAPDPDRAAAAARPVVQKFSSPSFVNDFQRDPQPSLSYTDDDRVQELTAITPLPKFTSGPNRNRTRQLGLFTAKPTDTRKLFLPAHQRFYLVAIQLHCDVAGFPRVDPDHVGEVGFVTRRRVSSIPKGTERDVAQRLAAIARTRAAAQSQAGLDAARARARLLVPLRAPARARVVAPRAATVTAFHEVALAKRRLQQWSASAGVSSTVQGWAPGPAGSIGAWTAVEDEPFEIVEQVYPMHRLAPDPADPEHAARFGTIYFGLLPTTSDQAGADGSPRFDDTNVYEVRCFARRVESGCPEPPVWSEPSEAFRLAGFMDPTGCANRPVNIRMPDFRHLEALNVRPSVRLSAPANSHLMFPTDTVPPTSGSVSAAEEICFFAIPLIMIVAFFLLRLFLPIVMLLFQLWWMLKLKFCIPPSAQLAADVNAELSAIPGGLSAAAGFDIDIVTGVDQANLQGVLRDGLNDTSPGLGDQLTATLTNNAIVQALLVQGLGTDGRQTYPATLPTEPRVTFAEVVHP